ncbi:hypothetical protein Tco_1107552 [Tanacetum coccineum]
MYTFSPMMVANSRKHHCRVRPYTREVFVLSTNLEIQTKHCPLVFRNRRGDEARIKKTWLTGLTSLLAEPGASPLDAPSKTVLDVLLASQPAFHVRRLEIRCTEFLESLPDIFFVQRFRDTLIQHMESVKKSIDERALHKREYDIWVNERQMHTPEDKVDSSKALDTNLVVQKVVGQTFRRAKIQATDQEWMHMLMMQISDPYYDEEHNG